MRELNFSYRNRRITARGGAAVFYCALIVLAVAGMGYAQAGRRVAKPKSDPPVPKSADPAAASAVKEPTPEPEKISMIVAGSPSGALRYALGAAENLPGVVGRRLQDSRRLQVASGGEMTRGEANKRAKEKETKTFVVWLEIEGNGFDFDPRMQRTRVEDLSVRYIVLEPGTGKLRDQGSVHLRPVSGGILSGIRRLPSCYPQPHSNFEFSLTVAGIETAERIMRAFSLPNAPLCS